MILRYYGTYGIQKPKTFPATFIQWAPVFKRPKFHVVANADEWQSFSEAYLFAVGFDKYVLRHGCDVLSEASPDVYVCVHKISPLEARVTSVTIPENDSIIPSFIKVGVIQPNQYVAGKQLVDNPIKHLPWGALEYVDWKKVYSDALNTPQPVPMPVPAVTGQPVELMFNSNKVNFTWSSDVLTTKATKYVSPYAWTLHKGKLTRKEKTA